MPPTDPPLSVRERVFCLFCAQGHSPREAARRADYRCRRPERTIARLLTRPEIQAEIRRVREGTLRATGADALAALRRLAFTPVNDAVALFLADETPPPETIDELDLFALAEFKRNKGGGEVKFHDRLKALEDLLAHSGGGPGASSLLEALDRGAAALGRTQAAPGPGESP